MKQKTALKDKKKKKIRKPIEGKFSSIDSADEYK
jgi:hypothetical protein